jgi:hypothetical protein
MAREPVKPSADLKQLKLCTGRRMLHMLGDPFLLGSNSSHRAILDNFHGPKHLLPLSGDDLEEAPGTEPDLQQSLSAPHGEQCDHPMIGWLVDALHHASKQAPTSP